MQRCQITASDFENMRIAQQVGQQPSHTHTETTTIKTPPQALLLFSTCCCSLLGCHGPSDDADNLHLEEAKVTVVQCLHNLQSKQQKKREKKNKTPTHTHNTKQTGVSLVSADLSCLPHLPQPLPVGETVDEKGRKNKERRGTLDVESNNFIKKEMKKKREIPT